MIISDLNQGARIVYHSELLVACLQQETHIEIRSTVSSLECFDLDLSSLIKGQAKHSVLLF